MTKIKKKTTPKNLASRVSAIELDRIEKTIKKNSEAIDKLFGISNKGHGAIKVLILIGSAVIGFFGYFKFKDFI